MLPKFGIPMREVGDRYQSMYFAAKGESRADSHVSPAPALAGPPYTTDDPEPVEYRHWELYLASQVGYDKGGWEGTGPHIEAN